ncbi:hypothetical protein F7195_00850 [Helicobacter pylori]|nr:hypothetical protein [Helicobacter pylori]
MLFWTNALNGLKWGFDEWGNDLYSPYSLTHFRRFRRFTHRRCVPIKVVVSALISCKNNAMNIF